MKRTLGIALLAVGLLSAGTTASAQDAFDINYMDVGPVVGLGGIHGATLSFGGRFEKAIKELPNAGGGILGIQVSVDYYHYDFDDFDFFDDDNDVTVLPIAVTVNYHFKIPNQPKIDVFAGAGLGYERIDFDCGAFDCDVDSGIYPVAHGGIRYFWRPGMAAYADIGAGAAALNIGLMFKIGGN